MIDRIKALVKRKLGLSFYTSRGVKISNSVTLGAHTFVGRQTVLNGNIEIGRNVSIGRNCCFRGDIIIGDTVTIGSGTHIYTDTGKNKTGKVLIGNRVDIGKNSTLEGRGNITIGHGVLISWNVSIIAASHNYKQDLIVPVKDMAENEFLLDSIIIGNDIWVGCNTSILMGSVIPDGCVIGANSLITKGLKAAPYTIIGGNPARTIRERFKKGKIEELLHSPPWHVYSRKMP